jgi:hypothetical protein
VRADGGRHQLRGSIGEVYLRNRGYDGPLPATLGFLPAWRDLPPAVICAFGMATEIAPAEHRWRWHAEHGKPLPKPSADDPKAVPWTEEPWVPDSSVQIVDADVLGVHLIKLKPDGSDRLRDIENAKITIGRDVVAPIILAPINDLLALTIGEGVEKTLADHRVSGAGAWASASAARLPGLADLVPSYIECVTVLVDENDDGRKYSNKLAARLHARGIEVLLTPTGASS